MQTLSNFFQVVMMSAMALFPIVNPIGNAFVINNFFVELNEEQRKQIVKKMIIRSFVLSVGALFMGRFVLALFGLSIPVIQIAGGALISRAGWSLLSADEHTDDGSDETAAGTSRLKRFQYEYLLNNIFYPLTFPMTIGAGVLSTLFTLAANSTTSTGGAWFQTIVYFFAIIVAIAIICGMLYFMLINTNAIEKRLGKEGKIVINKISAFFTICIGLQISLNGLVAFKNLIS